MVDIPVPWILWVWTCWMVDSCVSWCRRSATMPPLCVILSQGTRDQAFLWNWEVKAISVSTCSWWWENCFVSLTVFDDFRFGWLVWISISGFEQPALFNNCTESFDMSFFTPDWFVWCRCFHWLEVMTTTMLKVHSNSSGSKSDEWIPVGFPGKWSLP